MKGSAIGILGAACLAVGFGAGFVLRPVISPVTASPAVAAGVAEPSEGEATAAVRRHRLFTGTLLAGWGRSGRDLHDADRARSDQAEREPAKPANRICPRQRAVGSCGLVAASEDIGRALAYVDASGGL